VKNDERDRKKTMKNDETDRKNNET